MSSGLQNNYDRFAYVYDWLANAYSCGQIRVCKAAQIRNISPGARVCFTPALAAARTP